MAPFNNLFVILIVLVSIVSNGLTASNPITVLNQRVDNLERTMPPMRQMMNAMMSKITKLEKLTQAQAKKLTTLAEETDQHMSDMSRVNAELRQKNSELQSMLGTFERFFGSLLVESPESFDLTRNAIQRMDSLNAFLGNHESYLAGFRPDPVTVPSNDTVDTEELGRVLNELSEVNTDLTQKVTKLERRVASSGVVAGDRSLTGGTDDIFTLDQCSDHLKSLEAQLNALTAVQLDQDSSSRTAGSKDVISERDREILEGAVYGSARGVTSVRKSVFSVGSTRSMIGTSSPQAIAFDHIFVNKGNHWNATSHTYVSGITGYYYFYFSMRTYDMRYMGVTLMKNDNYVTALYTEADTRNVMESQGVILALDFGDRVWLRLASSTEYAIHSDIYKYCTFSGFLVYKGL